MQSDTETRQMCKKTTCVIRFSLVGLMLHVIPAAALGGGIIGDDLKLLPGDGAAFDQFGYSIDIDGPRVAVGAIFGGTGGAAYVFDAATGTQTAELVPADGVSGDAFGTSIAIDGGFVAVGSPGHDASAGSVYIFDADTGAQIAELVAGDRVAGDNFGTSVAMAGGFVAVGAPFDGDMGFFSGAVYVFETATWTQVGKFVPADGESGDRLGVSVAIDGGRIAAGAYLDDDAGNNTGAAYVFDAATAAQVSKLLPDDGATDDWFGTSVAIENGVVAVGSYQDDDNGTDSGSVYLYDADTGAQIAKLTAGDGIDFDQFGFTVALDRSVVVVGTPGDDDNGPDSGSAYLFDASTGDPLGKLLPGDGTFNDFFAWAVAADNGRAAGGAVFDG
ncbi:MAG TPA: hypothetical protein ENK11_07515, partial [Phycisphaerales bacterium]|nr:hypothetical protein [Phycisphaerales bacterium]